MLVRSVRTSHAYNFQDICGNESQPGLQLVKKLATPRNPGLGIPFDSCHPITFKLRGSKPSSVLHLTFSSVTIQTLHPRRRETGVIILLFHDQYLLNVTILSKFCLFFV